jgi:hypothetical protein
VAEVPGGWAVAPANGTEFARERSDEAPSIEFELEKGQWRIQKRFV